MKAIFYTMLAVLLGSAATACAQEQGKTKLVSELRQITGTIQGKVGIGVLGLDFSDTILINDNLRFPMQSVYKFPLAICILDKVDKGILSLGKEYTIPRASLRKNTWSPMLQDFKQGNIRLTLKDLLRYAVSKSDNNACDILFRLAGGTGRVQAFYQKTGITGMSIVATEAEMARERNVQYRNWCQPSAMLQLLGRFYKGKLLSPSATALLMDLMLRCETGSGRIRALLPVGTAVADKTGTGNSFEGGITTATNDVGIITLPGNQHYALVVYISDYKGGIPAGEQAIAKISKLVWDHYTQGHDKAQAR